MNLQNKFWNKRYNSIQNDIQTYITNIHTWAVLLQEACKNRQQWCNDKKSITGKKYKYLINNNELIFAKQILNFTIDGNNCIMEQRASSTTQNKKEIVSGNDEEEIVLDDEDDEEEIVLDEEEIVLDDEDTMRTLAEMVLTETETEQERLDKHMEQRRLELAHQKEIKSSNTIQFKLDTVDDTMKESNNDTMEERSDNIDTVDDTIDESNNGTIDESNNWHNGRTK